MRIMIVDANMVSARVLTGNLRDMGHECRAFASPVEALGVLESRSAKFDAAIIDYDTGGGFLERFALPGLRILVMSDSLVPRGDLGRIRALAEDFMSKPVDLEELSGILARPTSAASAGADNKV